MGCLLAFTRGLRHLCLTAQEWGCYHDFAGWSSLLARWAHNPKVGGSNPSPAIFFSGGIAQSVEQRNHNPFVIGSSPVAAMPSHPFQVRLRRAFLFLLTSILFTSHSYFGALVVQYATTSPDKPGNSYFGYWFNFVQLVGAHVLGFLAALQAA
jgi:hypothetical protein